MNVHFIFIPCNFKGNYLVKQDNVDYDDVIISGKLDSPHETFEDAITNLWNYLLKTEPFSVNTENFRGSYIWPYTDNDGIEDEFCSNFDAAMLRSDTCINYNEETKENIDNIVIVEIYYVAPEGSSNNECRSRF